MAMERRQCRMVNSNCAKGMAHQRYAAMTPQIQPSPIRTSRISGRETALGRGQDASMRKKARSMAITREVRAVKAVKPLDWGGRIFGSKVLASHCFMGCKR